MENQLITLLRITTHQLGSFVKDNLESNGIEVFFTNEAYSESDKYNPDEVVLKIKAGKSEQAIKVLLQIHKDYDLDKVSEDKSFTKLKKILVPVKLSDNCIDLCRHAMKMAKKINAEIKILYVYEDPTFKEPERHTASWEKYVKLELKEAFQKAQLKLVNFNKEIREKIPKELLDDVKMHYRMLKGTPLNVITDACKRYKPDFILMGTKQSHSEDGEFMGKTLAKVIDQAQYPVFAVPFAATCKEVGKINVMYETDFYDADNASLNKLLEILEPFDKKIHCVHIDLDKNPHKEKVDELNKMLEKDYSEYNIKCKLFESDNMVKGFNDFVNANDIDIISFSRVKRSTFYKIFHTDRLTKLVAAENIPILIFPV
ncbi:MAG: universal stress protein [Bacteroidota bacterium]